jgi:succinyl-diaminopimelate desuccinylase
MKTEAELQLATLVSMPTITADTVANNQALDYIEDYLAERGMYCRRFAFGGHGSLVATVRPGVKKPKVMLYAHVDVIAGDENLFLLRAKGDKLIGRGTYDMKFAIAAYLQLVDDLQDELDNYDFGIMVVTDEELGSRDGINGVRSLLQKGYVPQVCVLPDGGTDWDIETFAKGHWRLDLVASGRSAHSSRPWEGESASFKLVHALHELKQHFADQGPDTDNLNIGTIHGGTAYGQIPDSMEAGIGIRLANEESFSKNEKLIRTICKKYGVELRSRSVALPFFTDIESPLITAFAESIRRVVGQHPKGCVSYGTTDGPVFAEAGVPCVITRPLGGNHHGPGEWISRKSFVLLPQILRDYLETTAKTAPIAVDAEAALV